MRKGQKPTTVLGLHRLYRTLCRLWNVFSYNAIKVLQNPKTQQSHGLSGIPAQQPSYTGRSNEDLTQEGRSQFIRRLVRERFQADPHAQAFAGIAGENTDSTPEPLILSTADASLVAIAERFVGGHRKGLQRCRDY
jgi:hypothetical protein